MGNKHYNGSEPIAMPAKEYDRQAEIWTGTGGTIRDDHPHTGADYPHSHWSDGNPNEDFVVVRTDDNTSPEDTKDDDDTSSEETSSDDDDDASAEETSSDDDDDASAEETSSDDE